MLCSLFLYGTPAQAVSVSSSYTIKNDSHVDNATLKVTGGKTKTVTLKVKEKGVLKIALRNYNSLTGKEQVKVRILNSKGKSLNTKYVKKSGSVYINTKVSKGTYKVVFSTKSVTKNKSKKVYFGYVFNRTTNISVTANNKNTHDVVNNKGSFTFKLKNTKSQTVRICIGNEAEEDYAFKEKIVVKDSKGKVAYTDRKNHGYTWEYFYLPKGTYYVTYTGGPSRVEDICVKTSKKFSTNVVTKATSKATAASYTGAGLNLTHFNKSDSPVWFKIDTAKQDAAFMVSYGRYDTSDDNGMAYGNVYNENGTKVAVDDAWDCGFNFKKEQAFTTFK